MKISTFRPSAAAVALLTAALFAGVASAHAGQMPAAPEAGPGHRMRTFPAPTNLQVLPKDLTGEQVRKIMETWASALGTHCDTCHAPNPNAPPSANGRPRLDFALDIKPQKKKARIMYKMVEDINTNYVSMVAKPGVKVSCGTCHRGHVSPPPFVPPPEHRMDMAPPSGAPPQ